MKLLTILLSIYFLTACVKSDIPKTTKYIKFIEFDTLSVIAMPEYAQRNRKSYLRYRCVDGEAVRFIISATNQSIIDVTSIGNKCVDLDMNNDDDIQKLANMPKHMKPIVEKVTQELASSEPNLVAET